MPIIVSVQGTVSQILTKNRRKIEQQLILRIEEIPEENARDLGKFVITYNPTVTTLYQVGRRYKWK